MLGLPGRATGGAGRDSLDAGRRTICPVGHNPVQGTVGADSGGGEALFSNWGMACCWNKMTGMPLCSRRGGGAYSYFGSLLLSPFLLCFCWLPCPLRLRKREHYELDAGELRYPLVRPRCTRYFVRARPRRQAASDANSPASIAKDPCPPRRLSSPLPTLSI